MGPIKVLAGEVEAAGTEILVEELDGREVDGGGGTGGLTTAGITTEGFVGITVNWGALVALKTVVEGS